MYGESAADTRQFFTNCWNKYQQKKLLQPLEKQIVDVLLWHPEYQTIVTHGENHATYFPELGQTNPFLHMGLHLTLRDQIATNRPHGIQAIYQYLSQKHADPHHVEHLMIEPLAECLWRAQKTNSIPDEKQYLASCQSLFTE